MRSNEDPVQLKITFFLEKEEAVGLQLDFFILEYANGVTIKKESSKECRLLVSYMLRVALGRCLASR